jgi:hypothetical protein
MDILNSRPLAKETVAACLSVLQRVEVRPAMYDDIRCET